MSRWEFYVQGLEQTQVAMRSLFTAVRPEGQLPQLVHSVTVGASVEATKVAPRLTGTLASAHRERMISPRVGEVYLDPSVRNVVYGGYPATYGPIVHAMGPPRNWMEWVVDNRGKYLVSQAANTWLAENAA